MDANSRRLDGIESIELLPLIDGAAIVTRLAASVESCSDLRAAIAYWCIRPESVSSQLVRRLSGDGFLCADIHLPTDLDILCRMATDGANIFLYLFHPNPQAGELRMQVPPHLLHTKVLLFSFPPNRAELWVGSHNWTARALTGVNLEASLALRLRQEAGLYSESAQLLEGVRQRCERFDPAALNYYKWLQGQETEEAFWVLELSGSPDVLVGENRLTVYGVSEDEYKNLKKVDKGIVVSVTDPSRGGQERLFEATVNDTGRLTQAGVTFGGRRYAVQLPGGLPQLAGPRVPDVSELAGVKVWATVTVQEELFGHSHELPPAQRWEAVKPNPSRPGVGNLSDWFPDPTRPLVQRATPKGLLGTGVAGEPVNRLALTDGRPLVRRKAVRAKRHDGRLFTENERKGR